MSKSPPWIVLFYKILLEVIGFCYGFITLNVYILVICFNKTINKRSTKKEKDEIWTARNDLWDLSSNPLPGFIHRFFEVSNGLTLHYVEGGSKSADAELVIFLHGFPDSWFTWHHQLSLPAIQQTAHIIAVDLPGYGGSESLKRSTTTGAMETMTSFINNMLERDNKKKCILVAHDWGAVIGFRLASEAGFLFKHVVLLNGMHPTLAKVNASRCVQSFTKLIREYYRQPTRTLLLRHAYGAIHPLLKQLFRSHYVFAFLLPLPLARQLPTFGDYWFLRYLARLSRGSTESVFLASALGPGHDEIEGYPKGVLEDLYKGRKIDNMLSYYRHGLALGKWDKSINIAVMEARHGGSIIEYPVGSLMCPATIAYGELDTAFYRPMVFDGINEYFTAPNSCSVVLSKTSHWSMMSSPGREVVNEMIISAIEGRNLKDKVHEAFPDAKFGA